MHGRRLVKAILKSADSSSTIQALIPNIKPQRNRTGLLDKREKRIESVVLRTVRDTKMAREVEELYKYQCQICTETIITKAGRYAKSVHIKPLDKPHHGDDNSNNLFCLYPNPSCHLRQGIILNRR